MLHNTLLTSSVLSKLMEKFDLSSLPKNPIPRISKPLSLDDPTSTKITQSWLWGKLGQFLRPNDTLIVDSGTAQFGISDAEFPAQTLYITQLYIGSIGYSVPACIGASVAKREQGREGRVVHVVGDGSLQLTVQEIGTMVKLGLNKILMFVINQSCGLMENILLIIVLSLIINNKGYTIERAIHGPQQGLYSENVSLASAYEADTRSVQYHRPLESPNDA